MSEQELESSAAEPLSELDFDSFDESNAGFGDFRELYPETVELTDEDIEQVLKATSAPDESGIIAKSVEMAMQESSKTTAVEAPLLDTLYLPSESGGEGLIKIGAEALLAGFLTAAALRYTYRFDFLTPVLAPEIPIGRHSMKLAYKDLPDEHRDAVFAHLTARSLIVPGSSKEYGWMLRDDERRNVLKLLIESDNPLYLNAAIAGTEDDLKQEKQDKNQDSSNETQTKDSEEGGLERVLWDCLKSKNLELEKQNTQQLLLIHKVMQWLYDLSPRLTVVAPEIVMQYLGKESLLQPFRHLTGKWENGRFVSYFTGREKELNELYEYLAVLPPKSLADRIGRVVGSVKRSAASIVSGKTGQLPLLIYGPGGIGKSTLLAKFLLEHLTKNASVERYPYAYLDFDLSILDSREPLTILAEIARQLAVQFPASGAQWNKFREEWLESSRLQISRSDTLLIERRETALEDFAALLVTSGDEGVSVASQFARNLPFLLVFDTFEEIQYHNRDSVKDIFRFLNALRARIPQTKVILMGRAPLTDVSQEFADLESAVPEAAPNSATDFSVIELALGELRTEDAREYLHRQGISDTRLCDALINTVGGNPLSLRLIAETVVNSGLGSLSDEIDWSPSFMQRILGQNVPPKEVFQGVLFRRILGHIHNEEVARLAHPGLVLRRITPEIIMNVLAVPCGLGEITAEKSAALFESLKREAGLVTARIEANGETALSIRPDLRKIMIQMINLDDQKQSAIRRIHDNAISFYAARSGQKACTEELYHRLIIGKFPPFDGLLDEIATEEAIAAGFVSPPSSENPVLIWHALSKVIDELPEQAQTYLDARLNLELASDELWKKAAPDDRELMVLGLVSRRARESDPNIALRTLIREKERFTDKPLSALSPLILIEITLLERMSKFERAFEKSRDAILSVEQNFGGVSNVADRRLFQYGLLVMRLSARLADGDFIHDFLRRILDNNRFPGLDEAQHARYWRQFLRFAVTAEVLHPSSTNILAISRALSELSRDLPELQRCPMLAAYAVFPPIIDLKAYYFELSNNISPSLIAALAIHALKTIDRKMLIAALKRWAQGAVERGVDRKHLRRLLEIEDLQDELALEIVLGKMLNKPLKQLEEDLKVFFTESGVSLNEIENLYEIFVRQFTYFDLQEPVFEEARKLGELLPGEGLITNYSESLARISEIKSLSREQMSMIVDIFRRENLVYDQQTRSLLLRSIDRHFLSHLPVVNVPVNQLLSDLTELNHVGRLKDGTIPLQQWLANLARLKNVAEKWILDALSGL